MQCQPEGGASLPGHFADYLIGSGINRIAYACYGVFEAKQDAAVALQEHVFGLPGVYLLHDQSSR
jgi:hypothetical protein